MNTLFRAIYAAFVRLLRRFQASRMRMLAHAPIIGRRPNAFVSHPEPQAIGSFAKGQQMIAGNFQFGGQVIEAPKTSIWEISDDPLVLDALHGCAWIDDMVSTGAAGKRELQGWIFDWIRRYGKGSGPGWRPDLTGQRLIHWISHAIPIMQGQDKTANNAFLRSVARQSLFLSKTWDAAPPGLPRIRALTGMIYAGLVLEGMDRDLRPAVHRLGRECHRRISADGAIASRNPEELLEIFILLNWAARVLKGTGLKPDRRHLNAIDRIAPTLRNARLGDGALCRFHSGGRGSEGRLDQALAESGVRVSETNDTRMGYARMVAGRTTLVMDAAPPAKARASKTAHASTLGFELSSGRLPIICNCGPGKHFGPQWRRASRATACHSTVVLEDTSSSTIWPPGYIGNTFGERLQDIPQNVTSDRAAARNGNWLLASHDGYLKNFGIVHERRIFISPNGRELRGEDTMKCPNKPADRLYKNALRRRGKDALEFSCRFHIHPNIAISLDLGGTAVSLKLKSEEIWVFRQTGGEISVEESVYLDQQRLKPRPCQQIVVRGLTEDGRGHITWALTRAQEGNRYTLAREAEDELAPLV
jgi:uncharacterized heparinase superfamily protein